MNYLLVKHKVANYDKWKAVFEANGPQALSAGLDLEHVFRDAADPDLVFVLCKTEDKEKALSFLQDPQGAESAKKGAVIGTPEGWWLTKVQANWMSKR